MNLSMKWLSDFIEINVSPREFAEAMTMSGSKVEGYTIEGSELDRVVVGKILSVEKHPNADSLVICMLEVGEAAPVQIVTGAKNVFPGRCTRTCIHHRCSRDPGTAFLLP